MNELSNSLSTLNVSPVFLKNYEAFNNPAYRIIANQGGTRSGKTYSITQLLIFLAIKEYYEISIVSKTLPHVKRGVLRDFKKEMQLQKIYNDNSFNKSDYIYNFKNNSSYIEFFSADSADKLAGPGRDILFINEINMLNYEEWIALALRTRKKIIIDYNPIDEFSFIYDKILTRDDCIFIQSNYLDNYDFLPEEQINEIERLKNEDPYLWEIYGLGNVAKTPDLIFNNWNECSQFPNSFDDVIYALDFGFTNPTALLKIGKLNNELYIEELIYQSALNNSELIKIMKSLNIGNAPIYPDNEDANRISELKLAHFNIKKVDKAIPPGLEYCRRWKYNVHKYSVNTIKEFKTYKYKIEKSTGRPSEEPVKFNDHAMTALRYGVFSHGKTFWKIKEIKPYREKVEHRERKQRTKFKYF